MKKKLFAIVIATACALALAACGGQSAPSSTEAEDGQNPLMNYVGPYACDRATMKVEAEGMDGAKVTINWGSSYDEGSEWVISGTFDSSTLTITYADCVRTDYVYKSDGSVESETVAYEDGTGTIVFQDGDGIKATWNDEKEHMADGMEFTWAA